MRLRIVDKQWQQGQRMVIYGVVFLIMTLLILYSSNSSADLYSPFKVNEFRHAVKHTNLKKWAGKEGYAPVYGNKVLPKLLIPLTKIGRDAKGTLYRLIQRVSMTYSNLSFFFISPGKMQRFDTLFQKETGRDRKKSQSWLSTGWFTMVIAIEMCDNIKVYGMVPPNHCGKRPQPKRMPYHYYKPRGPDECVTYLQNERGRRGSHHRFITEKQVFARWAKQYNISYSHPTW
ncbi:alpha-N-acetylgalactosaminide alpha-2,6-sialyltransferase 6-like [Sinocyclocheilus anshuiensis]|uniref:alpha-N-acetylgalactosaminide alpha-2,6-sialyltransferase 6-like n=1 Tax=Sinocyclocheilus anshuiensis TaxID=1608454 RepID=UPI0007B904FF|nr:PREDICTED: alpha-N-acetylgalactosaminide alpha-2,6-sialyltransferase 6-like [Sinocyclocheilus anshuiensis]